MTIARELYAVVPGEFVAARNARAAEVRRGGDRGLAARVKALTKPSVAAWAVGAVVREEPGEVDALGELGAELRVAQGTANPAELRALSKRRRELTRAVTRTAARLADEHGVPLATAAQEQVEATWQAVVIDPHAERAVRSLLLTRTLDPGDLDTLDDALAVPGAVPVDRTGDDGELAPRPRRTAGRDDDGRPRRGPRAAARDGSDDDSGEPASAPRRAVSRRTRTEGEDEGQAPEPRRVVSRRSRSGDDGGEPAPERRRAVSRRTRAEDEEERPAPAPRRAISRRTRPETADAAPPSTRPVRRRRAGTDAAEPPADVAREIRRAERELRFRERAADHARAELEDARESLTRIEAQVLQTAARLEELRREVEERETELADLDAERTAADEEREDAEALVEATRRAVEEIRERLAELSG